MLNEKEIDLLFTIDNKTLKKLIKEEYENINSLDLDEEIKHIIKKIKIFCVKSDAF